MNNINFFGLADTIIRSAKPIIVSPYHFPLIYDAQPIEKNNLAFWINCLKKNKGSTLEIGCGTGRVTMEGLKFIDEYEGIDNCEAMLNLCKKKLLQAGLKSTLHLVDMLSFDLKKKFSNIIVPYLPFIYLNSTEERLRFFKRMNQHLKMNGLLIFDFFPKDIEKFETQPWLSSSHYNNASNYSLVDIVQIKSITNKCQLINHTIYETESNQVKIYINSQFENITSLADLKQMLKQSGFVINSIYGDYEINAYNDHEIGIIIAQKHQEFV